MIAIKNVTAHTMKEDSLVDNAVILVEDGKIIEVGTNLIIPDRAEIINGQGDFLMPGIIDAHCHVGMGKTV